jgi:lipoprotein-anchoring transpeptidase ErfK/SrfK
MDRRRVLFGSFAALVSGVAAKPALAFHEPQFFFEDPENAAEDDAEYEAYLRRRKERLRRRLRAKDKTAKRINSKSAGKTSGKRPAYKGRTEVSYFTFEKPGTIIVKTRERALYQVLGDGRARRYLVAVGREGFGWRGTARVGMKRENPTWTPPAEMIEREPKYERWVDGMPGGIPENPLGVRALYLYQGKKDTLFRIHGTNAPSSIGTAASSGCIRMLNKEVIELYRNTPVGTKVIVS